MATARSISSLQISDITECSICSESFKEPKVLPCIHTFCLNCLQTYGQDKKAGDEVTCPLCRQLFKVPKGGFKDLPNNYFINQLLQINEVHERETQGQQISCEMCSDGTEGTAATVYCIECGQHLCELCGSRHKRLKSMSSHQIVSLEQKPSLKELLRMTPSYCTQHSNKEIEFYCYDCKETACVVCYVDHKLNSHKCADVKKVSEEFHEQLADDIHEVMACAAKCKLDLNQLEVAEKDCNSKTEIVEAEISDAYDNLRSMLDSHHSQLMEELKSVRVKRLKELETRRDEFERHSVIMESFTRYCQEMRDKGTACEISRSVDDLHTRAAELVKIQGEYSKEFTVLSSSFDIMFIPSTETKNLVGELLFSKVPPPIQGNEKARVDKISVYGNVLTYMEGDGGKVGLYIAGQPLTPEHNSFEVEILDTGSRGTIGIGVVPYNYPFENQPGWKPGSVAFHLDDGRLHDGSSSHPKFRQARGPIQLPSSKKGDRFSCCVRFGNATNVVQFNNQFNFGFKQVPVYFLKNGAEVGFDYFVW